MIRLQVGRVPLKVHALLPLMLLLAARMGLGTEALAMLPALFVHEAGHLAAARLCDVAVSEMELAPFGAAIRLESPWNARAAQILCVALAGPAANLLAILVCSALAWNGLLAAQTARVWIGQNMLLMLVNLLPALPLDGGRALCAVLSERMGVQRAVRLGVHAGCALAALLVCATVYGGIVGGVWNIGCMGAAAYLIACGAREIPAAAAASAEMLLWREEELKKKGGLPVRIIGVPAQTTVSGAMGMLRPGRIALFLLYDEGMRLAGVVSEGELIAHFPALAERPLMSIAPDLMRESSLARMRGALWRS